MALDPTSSSDSNHPTPILYVNAGTTLYALHIGPTGIDKYCTSGVAGLVGSPVIFGGGATAEAIVVGNTSLKAISTLNMSAGGGGCSGDSSFSFTITTGHPTLGPPAANGSFVYVGYDNSANTPSDFGIASIQFSGGQFVTSSPAPATNNIGFAPNTNGGVFPAAVTPAFDVFFPDDGNHKFDRYDTTLAFKWATPALAGGQRIFTAPTVSGSLVFGATNQLIAYNVADGTVTWSALSGVTQVTQPAVGSGVVFLSESKTPQIHAIDTSTHNDRWAFAGAGATAISSLTTEPTLASDGTLYFGDGAGKVYALITDASVPQTAANDWPRSGYDNCNSNHSGNTGYTCQ